MEIVFHHPTRQYPFPIPDNRRLRKPHQFPCLSNRFSIRRFTGFIPRCAGMNPAHFDLIPVHRFLIPASAVSILRFRIFKTGYDFTEKCGKEREAKQVDIASIYPLGAIEPVMPFERAGRSEAPKVRTHASPGQRPGNALGFASQRTKP